MPRKVKHSRKDTLIYLVAVNHETDASDEPVLVKTKRQVFAQKKRAQRREFYAGAAFDMRPEIIFVVFDREYQDEMLIEYNGKEYQLIRTDDGQNPEDVDLICSGPGARPRTR